MKNLTCSLALLFTLFLQKTLAQSLYKVNLDEKISKATLIAEGRVVEQKSFWNPQHTMIYTSNKVEITKLFKGDSKDAYLEVVTVGGSVEGDYIEASDLLTLTKDQTGIFFCHPSRIDLRSPETKKILLDVYASSQGFLAYDFTTRKAKTPFAEYKILEELYPQLQRKTGHPYRNKKPSFKIENTSRQSRTTAVSITGFSPSTVYAGALLNAANNLLTINGSGFGTASGQAAVLFDDANDGNGGTDYAVAYTDPLIVSWSDNQIQVRVPTRAGTGTVKIRDATGSITSAAGTLNVLFSISTASFTVSSTAYTKASNLMNVDGLGGYTIRYSTNTAGSGVDFNASTAKAPFQRALTTWKEISGSNITEGGTTTTQVVSAGDGTNVVMYDNANTGIAPLAAGVLAVCYSSSSICTSDMVNNQGRKLGFDIVVRNSGFSTGSTSFTVGPCPPNASNYSEVDLETVILHELGHALNLGHINDAYQGGSVGYINPAKLMHYAVVNSTKRVSPDYSAKLGASYMITSGGRTYGSCTTANTEMTPLTTTAESKDDCPTSFPVSTIAQNTQVPFDLVHATSNSLVDPIYTKVRCDGLGASQTNSAWYAFRTNASAGGSLNLSVSGYSVDPGSLTTCTPIYAGVPVTGVRLSLYQVSSCPTPSSFPTPVSCTTFSGNGALSPISGLTANTTYLLYLEGIENTKAAFNVTFGGIVLPVRLKDFSGQSHENFNALSWTAESLGGMEKMTLQKSGNGTSFTDVAQFTSLRDMEKGSFKDYSFYTRTYYRLAFKNAAQHTEYSVIVSIQRNQKNEWFVYPNPARDILHVQFNQPVKTLYRLTLYNSIGQVVTTMSREVASETIRITTAGLAEGAYQLVISSENKEPISHKILIAR